MLEQIKNIGIHPADTPEQKLKKRILLLVVGFCFVAAPVWSYVYYLLGLEKAALVPIFYDAVIIPFVIAFALTKNEKPLVSVQIVIIFLCPAIMQWMAGGWMKSGPIILWSILSPLTALIFFELNKARIALLALIVAALCLYFFNSQIEHNGNFLDKGDRILLDTMNVAGATLVIFFAIQYFVGTLIKTDRQLEQERQKSESLLLNILPPQVAEELKKSGRIEPTLYHNTTIIFTDFKDFSQYSELFTPEELIAELGKCFEKFDEIITNHGLEKIKTMGDAYMCVGGIFNDATPPEVTATRAVRAAIEIAQYIGGVKKQRMAEGKIYWDIRIGVHTGDIVAGIVGKKKFAFDVWGDAVNIANRLETSSEEGRINISGSTYKLVKDRFACTHRGKLPIKNKGELDMYFVEV